MNNELYQYYLNDQQDRAGDIDWSVVGPRDAHRKAEVLKILQENDDLTAEDFHHASLILQHGDFPEDYQKAHECASKALELGNTTAQWLFAATWDRWQLSLGKAQRYGTQFIEEDGEWKLALPIETDFPDEERIKLGLPKLKDALDGFKKKYNMSDSD